MSTTFRILGLMGAAFTIASPALAQSVKTSAPTAVVAPLELRTAEPGTTPEVPGEDASGAIPTLPLEVQTSNGVSYLSGGVSDEELTELKTKSSEFDVQIALIAPAGAFIGDAHVKLLDNKGTVLLSADNVGPFFYANVPDGTYSLEITTNNASVVKNIKFAIKDRKTFKQDVSFSEHANE